MAPPKATQALVEELGEVPHQVLATALSLSFLDCLSVASALSLISLSALAIPSFCLFSSCLIFLSYLRWSALSLSW